MKLVFRAGVDGDKLPINVFGNPKIPVSWSTLHWVPTDEDWNSRKHFFGLLTIRSFRQPKWIEALYSDFSTLCTPDEGTVYAIVGSPWGEQLCSLKRTLDKAGPDRYMMSGKTLVAELRREQITTLFEEGCWQANRHFLLISRDKIPSWQERLDQYYVTMSFSHDLLENLIAIVANYSEHGIDAISTTLNIDALKEIAEKVSHKLNVPMQVST